jgi:hypothetical protein
MNVSKEGDAGLAQMIADYMEKGFLENIIDMFRHDSGLYLLVGGLIQDERVRVRLGITALIEELSVCDRSNISKSTASLVPLLRHPDAVVRGDACNLLGIIGDRDAYAFVEKSLGDEDANVRLIAQEALEQIGHGRS